MWLNIVGYDYKGNLTPCTLNIMPICCRMRVNGCDFAWRILLWNEYDLGSKCLQMNQLGGDYDGICASA